jgi:hypothetical protein
MAGFTSESAADIISESVADSDRNQQTFSDRVNVEPAGMICELASVVAAVTMAVTSALYVLLQI